LIGSVGGLIGLGGGELRLPLLVGLIGFTARTAVPMNQILSLVTLVRGAVQLFIRSARRTKQITDHHLREFIAQIAGRLSDERGHAG
jgi:uncharacterized protein